MSSVAAFIEVQSDWGARVSDFLEIRCNQESRNAMAGRKSRYDLVQNGAASGRER